MTERVRLRPTLGCAPVPVPTGRLPGLVNPSRPNASLHQLWIQPESLGLPSRRFSLDRYDASRVSGICDLRRSVAPITLSPQLSDEVFSSRAVFQARPHTTEPSLATQDELNSDSERPGGLSRYTPLPAIGGSLHKLFSDGDCETERRSDTSLATEELWLPSSGPGSPFHESSTLTVRLPPLRPVVRSRTFTILTSDVENDCWVDGDRIVRPDSDAIRDPDDENVEDEEEEEVDDEEEEDEEEEEELSEKELNNEEECQEDPVLTLRCERLSMR